MEDATGEKAELGGDEPSDEGASCSKQPGKDQSEDQTEGEDSEEYDDWRTSHLEEGTSSQPPSLTTHLQTQEVIRKKTELSCRRLLLTTLEKMNTDQLRRFQSLLITGLPGYPPIPENADRQDTVDQMVQRYDPERAVFITKEILRRMNRNDLCEEMRIRDLLLTTLENMNTYGLKRFRSFLATGVPGYPLIPENQLENADRQDTVDQMVEMYGSNGAVKITLEILKITNRNYLFQKLKRDHNREGLLMTTLEKLNPEDLKRFQSLLTTGLPGYPPIPENQLENADRQDTVDQMMQRYKTEGAVFITLRILRRMNRNDLAKEIMRRGLLLDTLEKLNTEDLKRFQSLLTTGLPGYPPIPENQLENADRQNTVDQMMQRYKTEGAVIITLKILRRMNRNDLAKEMMRRGLLLDTLEKLIPEDLKRFQSLLTTGLSGYPPIPENQLENADRQNTVDQMVQRYDPEGAVIITLTILRKMNRSYIAVKLQRDLNSEGLLMTTLEKLNPEELKRFQSLLTTGLPGYPPIPENQLENAGRQNTVDQMVQRYDPEGAVIITLDILRMMNRNDLAKEIMRRGLLLDTLEKLNPEELKRFQSLLTTGLSGYPPIPENQLENADRQNTVDQMVQRYDPEGAVKITLTILRKMNRNDLVVKLQSDLNSEGLLMATLEKLNTEELRIFQSLLTTGLPGYPLIPENQLENADRQDTVDQMVQRYKTEGAVIITLRILRRMNRNDLAKEIMRRAMFIRNQAASSKPPSSVRVSQEEESDDERFQQAGRSDMETLSSKHRGIQKDQDALDLGAAMENPTEPMVEEATPSQNPPGDEGMVEAQSSSLLTEPALGTEFDPEVLDHENQETYRFQCSQAGVFQCRITGLAFGMEGEGEVLYRTVTWDRRLLAHSRKRPAGPLFKFTCLKGSACQLHLAHCQIRSVGGCDFLSVAHVTDDGLEFLPPTMITDTHVIINITGFSAYGNVEEDNAPISPINALVVLFFQPPVVNETRCILKLFLLPSNVDIRKVQNERRSISGDKETYVDAFSCQLTPMKDYTLSTDPTDAHRITPKKAKVLAWDSYENYVQTFRLLFKTFAEEVNLLLKEDGGTKSVWEDVVCLPASTTPPTASTVGNASTDVELLFETLQELDENDLKTFKWYLRKKEPFSKSELEQCRDRLDTVDLMVQKYSAEGATTLTLEILRKMKKNDLADDLSKKLDKH